MNKPQELLKSSGIPQSEIQNLENPNALTQHWAPSQEEMQCILNERAQRLARRPNAVTEDEGLEIMEFQLGEHRYGMASSYVKEVLPLPSLTPIPCTPPYIRGVTLIRTRLISVVDLRYFLNLDNQSLNDLNRLMILRHDHMETGILTDAIDEVRCIPMKDILPPPGHGTETVSPYLLGVSTQGLSILDGKRLLDDPMMKISETVM